jgi:class 3 adenylate cyclase
MNGVKSVLLISRSGSSLGDSLVDHFGDKLDVHVSEMSRGDDFLKISTETDLIIFDLTNEAGLLDRLLSIREYLPLGDIPAWAVYEEKNISRMNLFYSFGGSRYLHRESLFQNLLDYKPSPKRPRSADPAVLPSMSSSSQGLRLTEHLDLLRLNQIDSDVPGDGPGLHRYLESLLNQIQTLVKPHLALILINDNMQACAFVKPDKMVFMQDYKDFMNFCLGDFFSHFQGLNLEEVKEIFFLAGREDFSKLNMNQQKISSYFYLPICNRKGEVEASLHLGHLQNNYFSDKMTQKIKAYIQMRSGTFFYALRAHQLSRRQKKILNIFGRFVPMEIIPDLINKKKSKEEEKVEKREITILFSDIRSFTTITEKNGAQEVVDFLNRHFNVMVSIIKKHGGTIDKFIGDAIVAMFGVPMDTEDKSARAVKAAIEMIQALSSVDCTDLILENGKYNIGIGIHKGSAIIGNVGSMEKADYTAIGDVIGVAEELEALTKNYAGSILVSEDAMKRIGPSPVLKKPFFRLSSMILRRLVFWAIPALSIL